MKDSLIVQTEVLEQFTDWKFDVVCGKPPVPARNAGKKIEVGVGVGKKSRSKVIQWHWEPERKQKTTKTKQKENPTHTHVEFNTLFPFLSRGLIAG
jgi:hypothetical protein